MKAPLAAYLVRGAEPILRADATRAVVSELVGEGDAGLMVEEHSPAGEDTTAVADAARTPPFLAERRVVVVRDVTAYDTRALQPLLDYLEDPSPTTSVVMVVGDGGRPPARLVESVSRVGTVLDAGAPRGRGRSGWLASHLRQAHVRLDAAATGMLEAHLGDDLGRLASLLEALSAAYGADHRLGAEDLRPFLGEAGSVPPWELTDAIDRGDAAAAVGVLHRLLGAGGRHPLQVMAQLHGNWVRLLRLDGANAGDEAAAAALLGLRGSTFPARKALAQARRLGHEGVAEGLALLAEADLDLRGRRAWPNDLVLEILVARLARLSRRRSRPP